MIWLSVGLFPYVCWLHCVWKVLLLIQFWEIYLNYFVQRGVYFVWCMKLFENVFFGFFMTMKLLFTCSLIFSTCENSLLFCLCFLLISWMQCLTLLRMSCFFSPLFFDVFFFSWVALFPSSSFVSALVYVFCLRCLVIHGCKRVAAGPNITSIFKTGRRVEEVSLAPSISSYKESKNFPRCFLIYHWLKWTIVT